MGRTHFHVSSVCSFSQIFRDFQTGEKYWARSLSRLSRIQNVSIFELMRKLFIHSATSSNKLECLKLFILPLFSLSFAFGFKCFSRVCWQQDDEEVYVHDELWICIYALMLKSWNRITNSFSFLLTRIAPFLCVARSSAVWETDFSLNNDVYSVQEYDREQLTYDLPR